MTWRFRKNINLGLLRITISRTGIGWSVGGKGFRSGVDAKGKKYTTLSIPGSGISKRSYESNQAEKSESRKLIWFLIVCVFIVLFFIRAFF